MVKREVNIDEKWPVFTLDEPRNENSPFTVEISEEDYKEYLWIMYKYHQWQIKIQGYYDIHQHRLSEELCGRRFPESSGCPTEYKINRIRNDSPKEQIPTVLSESHA